MTFVPATLPQGFLCFPDLIDPRKRTIWASQAVVEKLERGDFDADDIVEFFDQIPDGSGLEQSTQVLPYGNGGACALGIVVVCENKKGWDTAATVSVARKLHGMMRSATAYAPTGFWHDTAA